MKKTLNFTVACLLVFGSLFMLHSAEETPKEKWQASEIALGKAVNTMETLNGDLKKHRKEFSELSRNLFTSLAVAFSPVDAAKTLFLGRGTPNRAFELKTLMISIFVQQEALNGELANLASARDTAYEEYKKTTSQPDAKEFTPNYADIPTIVLPCMGGCGHTYSSASVGMGNLASKSLQGHAVYCSSEPHKRKKNWYFGCRYTSCPASDQHERACVGNCGNIGPAQWAVVDDEGEIWSTTLSNKNRTAVNDEVVTIASHKRKCPKRIPSPTLFGSLGKTDPCPYYYYQCNSSNTCPNASNHVSSSSGSTPPEPTPPTDNTPNCMDCTSHCSSPCSCTNSGTCNGTVVAPPPPTTILCRLATTTGCTIRSSDGRACRVPMCPSGCGSHYWTCTPNATYDHTTPFTCRRCGTKFTRCNNSTCTHNGRTYSFHWAR